MPIHEYECSKCGVVEVTQSITDPPINKCPHCRRKVKRLISLNNFHLKGSGWYATDYAPKANEGNSGNSKPSPEKSDSSKESPSKSSESKKKEEPKTTSTET